MGETCSHGRMVIRGETITCECGATSASNGETPLVRVVDGTTVQHMDDGLPFGEHMCSTCGRVVDLDMATWPLDRDEHVPVIDRRDVTTFAPLQGERV